MNIEFLNFDAFYFLLILLVFLILLFFVKNTQANYKKYFSDEMYKKIFIKKESYKISFVLLLMAYIFIVLSIARPVNLNEEQAILKDNGSFLVLFDVSDSMQAKDIYPSRIEFTKRKFDILLENLTNQKLGVLAFATQAYLISAITSDYESLKYVVGNLDFDTIDTKGTNLLEALKKVPEFLDTNKQKVVLVFTDGTEEDDFTKEITYAKKHNIKIFIYATASKKGIPITRNKKFLKNSNGDIVITSLNSNIQNLAEQTNGKYIEFSFEKNDINELLNPINKILKKEHIENNRVLNQQELFFIPLSIAILFYLSSLITIKRTER